MNTEIRTDSQGIQFQEDSKIEVRGPKALNPILMKLAVVRLLLRGVFTHPLTDGEIVIDRVKNTATLFNRRDQ